MTETQAAHVAAIEVVLILAGMGAAAVYAPPHYLVGGVLAVAIAGIYFMVYSVVKGTM